MGTEDTFLLPDRYNDAYKAMGDGVVVPVVRWLSQQLVLPIAEDCQSVASFQNLPLESSIISAGADASPP